MFNHLFKSKSKELDALESFYKVNKQSFLEETKQLGLSYETQIAIYQDSVIETYQKLGYSLLDQDNPEAKAFLFGVIWGKIEERLGPIPREHRPNGQYEAIVLDKIELTTTQKELKKNFAALSETIQRILKGYYCEILTPSQIAERTNLTDVKTVENLRKRGLKRLMSQSKSR